MARLIVKASYLKPTQKRTPGRYAKYIGTREGVAKIDDSAKFHEPRDRDTTYADYIATRPRAEKIGKHGLFTDAGVEVDLDKVSDELNNFKGTIWTVIVSVKREDAEMLGFETGERWRNMVRANRDELAKSFRMHPSDMQWYGAFHDESYHPHIHLIVFDKKNGGYLDKEGIENIKRTFAHVIFQDEMLNIQNEKTDRRDQLRLRSKEEIEEIIKRIKNNQYDNTLLKAMILDLSNRLKKHKGKKAYGYLKKGDKYIVDRIVEQIEKIPEVKELYDLWYEQQEALRSIYSETPIPRVPLSENPEFKTIKNAVINAASELDIKDAPLLYPADDEEDIYGINIPEEYDIPKPSQIDRTHPADQQKKNNQHNKPLLTDYPSGNQAYMTTTFTRLLNNISKIFEEKFRDNPKHSSKVDIKLWIKIQEKKEAHGIKQE